MAAAGAPSNLRSWNSTTSCHAPTGGPNDITNRILLCPPCNKRKSARYTLSGLRSENKKAGWMRNEDLAKIAQHNARAMADRIRSEMVG